MSSLPMETANQARTMNGSTRVEEGGGTTASTTMVEELAQPTATSQGRRRMSLATLPRDELLPGGPTSSPPPLLPPPATQKLKFRPSRVRVTWAKVSKRLTSGPTPTASLIGSGTEDGSDLGRIHSLPGYSRRVKRKRSNRSITSTERDLGNGDPDPPLDEDEEVDEVVVEATLPDANTPAAPPHAAAETLSDAGLTPSTHQAGQNSRYGTEHSESLYQSSGLGLWEMARWRIYPLLRNFFDLSFREPEREDAFKKEQWWNGKLLCLVCTLYLVLQYILYAALTPQPNLYDKVLYYGVAAAITLPMPVLTAFDFPRRYRWVWQTLVALNAWFWPYSQIIDQRVCGFFGNGTYTCGNEFLSQGYFAVAFPFMALFALQGERFIHLLGSMGYVILGCTLILPLRGKFARNLVNFIIFIWLVLILSYIRERMDRGLFTLRDQLKIQYKATQRAQIAERKSNNSKRRFVSYIFHEVRVPLNTALLALQTLEAGGLFSKSENSDYDIEYTALQGSLGMMSKVLNDVLDFNRMESGRLEHVASAFDFHAALKSMLGALRVATSAKRLDLEVELDDRIDAVARKAAAAECSEDEKASICPNGREMPAFVIGDEMRLRQVVTNLASNACKFTPEGGKISIKTRLVFPDFSEPNKDSHEEVSSDRLAKTRSRPASTPHLPYGLRQPERRRSLHLPKSNSFPGPAKPEASKGTGDHEKSLDGYVYESNAKDDTAPHPPSDPAAASMPQKDMIVVRIEITDTGVGLRPKDVADAKLFSPYVQTEIGKKQGGKGTGLGLALVRSIVQLSGGRLGVKSKRNVGSTFWVELPFAIGRAAIESSRAQQQQQKQQGIISSLGHGASDDNPSAQMNALTVTAQEAAIQSEDNPRFLTADGKSIPLRPIPQMQISFSQTESPYSEQSQLYITPIDEDFETDRRNGVQARDYVASAQPGSFDRSEGYAPSLVDPDVHGPPLSPTVLATTSDDYLGIASTSASRAPPPTPTVLSIDSLPHAARHRASSGSSVTLFGSPDTPTSPSSSSRPLQVMVVDDDALTRTLMTRTITRLLKHDGGAALATAENGQAALDYLLGSQATGHKTRDGEVIAPHDVDCIFLDHQMPMMTGLQVVAALRQANRQEFVVGCTGNALTDDVEEYYAAGADHVLTKPVRATSLKDMLDIARQRRDARAPVPPATSATHAAQSAEAPAASATETATETTEGSSNPPPSSPPVTSTVIPPHTDQNV